MPTQEEIVKKRHATDFCRLYLYYKKQAADCLYHIPGAYMGERVNTGQVSDRTLAAVEKRERLLKKCELIENCAKAVDGGRWAGALMYSVCKLHSIPLEDVPPSLLPSNNRTSFFKARKQFIGLISESLDIATI